MNDDGWAACLYRAIKRYQLWPHMWRCTPPLRHKPLDTDDEVEFWSDMRYLQDLSDAILSDCQLAKAEAPDIFDDYVGKPLLQAVAIPVESQRFWDEWDWPVDYAATLISLWKFDNELERWMSGEAAA